MESKEVIEGIEAAALECPLCMNRFTRPKILPCVHSFCLECLEEWAKKSSVLSCPTCREVCQIPEGGLQNLGNNIVISGLLDYVTTLEQKTAPTCSLCSRATPASFFCQDCDELYCTPCRNSHKKMKMSQHHRIITMEEYAVIDPLERLASKPVLCSEHNMPFPFYCDSCEIPVCVGCTQIKHSKYDGHDIVEIKTAFESFSTRSQSFIKTSDKRLKSFQEIANELKKKKSLEMSNYKKRQATITEDADKSHRLIDQYKTEQLRDLESTYQNNLQLLNAYISDVESAIAKVSSMQGIARTLIHSPNHAMALRYSSDVSERMDEHLQQHKITDDMQKPNLSEYDKIKFEVIFKPDISKSEFFMEYDDEVMYPCVEIHNKYMGDIMEDVKLKCLRINKSEQIEADRDNCSSVDIICDWGTYYIMNQDPRDCTLIVLIINGSDVLFKTVEFDAMGTICRESNFNPL